MNLTDLLERTAGEVPVGPVPLEALHAGVKRRRRRRTASVAAAAAAAVAAVIGGSTLVTVDRPSPPSTVSTPVPPALRLVGFGHAAIAVPADWPTNKAMCGTPQQDTVLIDDPSARLYCMSYRRSGVESLQLSGTPTIDFHADEVFELNGLPAERQRTTCSSSQYPKIGPGGTAKQVSEVTICAGAVGIPSLKVWFRADSSTSADEVDRMLARIRIVPDRSGVPSPGSGLSPLVGDYAPRLAAAGLKLRTKQLKLPSYPSGTILGVSPAAGTMLLPGSTVTVTVAR